MVGNLEELRARGQGVIESRPPSRLETLLEVQKRLSALNGYRINAWLVPATVRFVRLAVRCVPVRMRPGPSPSTCPLSPSRSAAVLALAQRPTGAPDAAEAGVEGWRRKAGKGLSRPEKAWSRREKRTAPEPGRVEG